MIQAGWSLAQALSCIIQHKCGIKIDADQNTSIVEVMDFEEDMRLPPNAATEAEQELLSALASGKISAFAVSEETGEPLDIPARSFLRLHISPSFEGDRLAEGSEANPKIAYREVRLLPEDVRRHWPLRVPGQKPTLRVVSDTQQSTSAVSAAVGYRVQPTLLIDEVKLTPGEQEIRLSIDALTEAGQLPVKASNRNQAIKNHMNAFGKSEPSTRSIERTLRKIATRTDI